MLASFLVIPSLLSPASAAEPPPTLAVSLAPGSPSPASLTASTDPDHDGLPTAFEVGKSRTDPNRADSDGDGTKDGKEDPDHDGLTNRLEYRLGLHPRRSDTNRDGTKDGDEDTDRDGLTNAEEVRLKLDPARKDTDGDGISDGKEDLDGDRLSNRFELRRSRTDPLDGDTEHDGIRDGAEDPDKDRLSNAGEELSGTNPRRADSDGDGISDWSEDADHNGRRNGMQQDARPVPVGLVPRLKDAASVLPPGYADGCHVLSGTEVPFLCSYYGTDSARSLFLVGDSHAAQWQPALMDIARRHGWRLYVSTKSGCPVATVTVASTPTTSYVKCDQWRESVFQIIESLKPDLVIAANRNDYHIVGAYDVGTPENTVSWHDGMVVSLERLRAAAGNVLLLGDTPVWTRPIPTCLKAHRQDISACSDRMSVAISAERTANDRSAARDAGASFRVTAPLVCNYDPCPTVIDHWIIAYDDDHLQPTFSKLVARGIERLLPAQAIAAR